MSVCVHVCVYVWCVYMCVYVWCVYMCVCMCGLCTCVCMWCVLMVCVYVWYACDGYLGSTLHCYLVETDDSTPWGGGGAHSRTQTQCTAAAEGLHHRYACIGLAYNVHKFINILSCDM